MTFGSSWVMRECVSTGSVFLRGELAASGVGRRVNFAGLSRRLTRLPRGPTRALWASLTWDGRTAAPHAVVVPLAVGSSVGLCRSRERYRFGVRGSPLTQPSAHLLLLIGVLSHAVAGVAEERTTLDDLDDRRRYRRAPRGVAGPNAGEHGGRVDVEQVLLVAAKRYDPMALEEERVQMLQGRRESNRVRGDDLPGRRILVGVDVELHRVPEQPPGGFQPPAGQGGVVPLVGDR